MNKFSARNLSILSAAAAAMFVFIASPSHAGRIDDLPVSAATYLGGTSDDSAGGVAVALDGTLLFAGSLPGHDPGGVAATTLLGGGDGVITRLSNDGRQVLENVRVGSAVVDLEIADDGRVVVAAESIGFVMTDAALENVEWSDPLTDPVRAAVGGSGTDLRAAVLTAGKVVRVFDADGAFIGERSFSDSVVADVAVSPDGARIVVAGYNNRTSDSIQVQIPFLRAFDPTMSTLLWQAYDWTVNQLVDEQSSSLADSRGLRVAFGEDDALYFAGRTDGGNNTFRYDPLIVDRLLPGDELVSYDEYTNTAGISGAFAITVFGRFDAATGDVLKLQYLLARLSGGNGNSVVPAAITADADGRVFVGGQSFASIDERNLQKISGTPVGAYQGGEAFLLAVDPDFSAREVWTVFTATGGPHSSSVVGLGARDGRVAWAVDLRNSSARLLTTQAVQADRDAGDSAYLATLPWPLFFDGFESGDTSRWSSMTP